MHTYSLAQLERIFSSRHYLSKERFLHYFTTRYGYNERDAKEKFEMYCKFPKHIYEPEKHMELNFILEKAIELIEEIQTIPRIPPTFQPDSYQVEREKKKIVYKENDEIKEFIFSFYDSGNVITYAELLKREVEIIACLSFCCSMPKSYNATNEPEMLVFDGDVFDTNDNYYSSKSSMYLAHAGNLFSKLEYIKGKGYIHKGEPFISEEKKYNYHVVTLTQDYQKIGNIFLDMSILYDNVEATKE